MFRYVALCWNAIEPDQCITAKQLLAHGRMNTGGWQLVAKMAGCAVFCSGVSSGVNGIYPLHADRGVVLGKIFSRADWPHSGGQTVSLGAQQTENILRSGGDYLAQSVWGRYVAFWIDSAGRVCVFRDPSGTFPCFEMCYRGVRVYFSWLQDCLELTSAQVSINWAYVSALLPLAIVQGRSTGLNEVDQVFQGEEVALRADGAVERRICWNPHAIASDKRIEDPAAAARALREVTRECVHAWAGCYQHILLRLSGGIDSSIVAACLKDAPSRPQVTCLTHYSEGAHSDERDYARRAAAIGPYELIESAQPDDVRLQQVIGLAPTPIPSSCVSVIQNDGREARIAHSLGASSIFGGGGGDQVFYQSFLGHAATDYVLQHGPRAKLFSICLSAARAERRSVWPILRKTFSDARDGRGRYPAEQLNLEARVLLSRSLYDVARNERAVRHVWFQIPNETPPGKALHIYTLSTPAEYYDVRGNANDPEYVHPLLSQPLLELVLRIPVYVLTEQGWDRALARRAFGSDLPREIVTRRTKGVLDTHAAEVLRRNLQFVREYLLEGSLVQRGLLDRSKLEQVLSGRPTSLGRPVVELFDYLSVEAWLRSWSSASRAAAA